MGIIDINRVLQNYNSGILSGNFPEMHPKSNELIRSQINN